VSLASALDSEIPAPSDVRPVGQILIVLNRDAPVLLAVAGGGNGIAAEGAVVTVRGANMLPRGGGGSFSSQIGSGFGYGNEGNVGCFVSGGDFISAESAFPSESKRKVATRFVSSALVQCEVAGAFLGANALETEEGAIEVVLSVGVNDRGFDAGAGAGAAGASGGAGRLRVVRGARLASASNLRLLPSVGGSDVRVTWEGISSWNRPLEANGLACAFGAIAPVSMRLGFSGSNSGSCSSPALAPTPKPEAGENFNGGIADGFVRGGSFSLPFPNAGPSAVFQDARLGAYFVLETDSKLRGWVVLPSSASGSGGSAVAVAGFFPKRESLSWTLGFGTDGSCPLFPGEEAGSGVSCVFPASRGGFVTLSIQWHSRVSSSEASAFGRYGGGTTRVALLFQTARAASTAPPSVSSRGDSIVSVSGKDFQGPLEGRSSRCAFDDSISVSAIAVSSALIRCEVPRSLSSPAAAAATGGDSPPRARDRKAFVSVAFGADTAVADFPNGVSITFLESPIVTRADPSTALADAGGTLVTATGSGFRPEIGSAKCVFGTVKVSATFLTGQTMECVAPTKRRGSVPFAVVYEYDSGNSEDVAFAFA
jgi:hypothetical protein